MLNEGGKQKNQPFNLKFAKKKIKNWFKPHTRYIFLDNKNRTGSTRALFRMATTILKQKRQEQNFFLSL